MGVEVQGLDLVHKHIRKAMEQAEAEVIRVLSYLGEQCVIEARDRSPEESWYDQTGNLRNSVGYCIVQRGEIVSMSGFKGKDDGAESGKGLAESVAKTITGKYALIVVAGMHYAVYVEAMENKVVLASAELYARKRLPDLMRRLNQKLSENVDR
ncbi:MAG: hypothetical protein Q4A64_03375 [Porphyromonadaceae bacterium]|nr:hypothetical protein [Porphyromonadaceae bacterium]